MLPLMVALAAPPTLVVRAEPLGTSDDRTAYRIEELLRATPEPWVACFPVDAPEDAGRFAVIRFRVSPSDGHTVRPKLHTRTGTPGVDDCALALARKLVVDRLPMYPDHIELFLTWAVAAPDAAKPTPPASGAPTTPPPS